MCAIFPVTNCHGRVKRFYSFGKLHIQYRTVRGVGRKFDYILVVGVVVGEYETYMSSVAAPSVLNVIAGTVDLES